MLYYTFDFHFLSSVIFQEQLLVTRTQLTILKIWNMSRPNFQETNITVDTIDLVIKLNTRYECTLTIKECENSNEVCRLP